MRADLAQARLAFLASGEDDLLPIVDAHHHYWSVPTNPHLWLTELPHIPFRYGDYSAICRDFLPPDYLQAQGVHLVLRHVTMEGEWDPTDPLGEAVWMQALAERCGEPHAMSAQIWLDRAGVGDLLARYTQAPLRGFVRSVRHKPRSAPRDQHHPGWSVPGSMRCDRWRQGYAQLQGTGLLFELQAPWWHMDEALELARDFPSVPVVVNHAGLPAARDADSLAQWRLAMERLAQAPNVAVKLSGLGVPGQAWTADFQAPVVNTLIGLFGVYRCVFASNFPVDGLLVSLDTLWSVFKGITQPLSPTDRLALFCDNAVRLYGLE
ncbi:MAG: hypothetical protein RJA09_302 [Pseudomonadota bacterium]